MTDAKVIDIKTEKKTIGEQHIYTQELIKILQNVQETETITYTDMSASIGVNVSPDGPGYGYQKSARDYLEREYDIVFEVLPTIGLRHMTHEEVALSTGSEYNKKKASLLKRSKRKIKTVANSYDNLSQEAQIKTTLARTIIAFDSEVIKAKNIKQIENRVQETNKLVGFKETLSLFEK